MIGLDFPVKPEWIHAVHQLWQPQQPISELVDTAVGQVMPELGGDKTRRNSLTIILRYFVGSAGGGQSRRTAARDVWVAYSQAYPVKLMAPAYLAHLTNQNEVAQELSRFLARRYTPGDSFTSHELRHHVSAAFGQRKVITNAASAFLRTLDAFGVLMPGLSKGEYRLTGPLPVSQKIFPLLVWVWWQTRLTPQIDLDDFAASPVLTFVQTDKFAAYWPAYQSILWALDERLEGRRATLKYVEDQSFEAALFRLLPA